MQEKKSVCWVCGRLLCRVVLQQTVCNVLWVFVHHHSRSWAFRAAPALSTGGGEALSPADRDVLPPLSCQPSERGTRTPVLRESLLRVETGHPGLFPSWKPGAPGVCTPLLFDAKWVTPSASLLL